MHIIMSFLVVVLLAVGSIFGFYNGMVEKSEAVDAQLHQVETQLQRRADLIPNLVSTVKGYATHEEETLKAVTNARSQVLQAKSVEAMQEADASLNTALGRLLAVSERYPELKANVNFIQLQDELAGTENRIGVARKGYNDAVREYNTKIKSLPYSLVAGMLGFTEKAYFSSDEKAKEVPKVFF